MSKGFCNNEKGSPVLGCAVAAPAAKPQKKAHVDPIIQPAKFSVVVRKFFKDAAGNRKPYTRPRRQRVLLKTTGSFDGTGALTRSNDSIRFFKSPDKDDEMKFDGAGNVFKGAQLTAGVTLYAEGAKPSGALDDIKLTLHLAGGSKTRGPDASTIATSVEVTLDICKARPAAGVAPPPLSQDDKITVGRNLLVQDTAGHFQRAQIIIQQVKPATFTGTLVVEARNHVTAFASEKPTKGEREALPYTIPDASKIPATGDRTLWAQGKTASKDVLDSGFTVSIKDLQDHADQVKATSVHVQLDICQSRKAAKVDPAPMSADDKLKIGRFVHVQDASGHHGRALLVVRKIEPEKFKGTLVLRGFNANKIELFANERPTAGEVATALPHEIQYDPKDATKKNDNKKFWVQGKSGGVSNALRDVSLFLHLKEDPPANADTILMTVVKFSNFRADMPSTPARTIRYGNSPVARHPYVRSGAAADHFDEDETKNLPFALVEGSVRAANPIKLSVQVAPAGVPVLWSVLRDTRPAPNGDHPTVRALSGSPTHMPDSADPGNRLKREMLADGVGTFHVRPFVDCNGSGNFEQHIDFEPDILMIMLLIRVQGHSNTSVAQPANAAASITGAGGGVPSSANGIRVRTGNFTNGTNDAVHQIATVTVIGGGNDGRRGLDPATTVGNMLFAGWMNNELDSGPVGEDVVATYMHTPPPLPNPAGGPPIPQLPVPRSRISVRVNPAANPGVYLPGAAAPAAWDLGPVLDTSINATAGTGGNTVVGTEGAIGPPVPIVKNALAIGERWTVEMWDSPGDRAPVSHGGFAPTRLIAYRFNLDFRSDLVFWTNTAQTPAVTAANEPTHRLYSTVQTNTWRIRAALAFDAAGNAVAPVPANAAVTLTKDADVRRRATPLDDQPAETRGPQLLSMLAIDARN